MAGDALDDYLESRAAAIEVRADDDHIQASFNSLKADFPDVLRAFADVLRRPAFDPRKLEVARNQAISEVSRQNDDAGEISFRELKKAVYGPDSPYAVTESFASLGRSAATTWWPGTATPSTRTASSSAWWATSSATRRCGRSAPPSATGRGARRRRPPEVAYRKQPSPGVYYAEKDDVTQSYIMMGHLAGLRSDPDYYAIELLNQLFSGSFASRLVDDVRTRKGLAYSVFGQVDSD